MSQFKLVNECAWDLNPWWHDGRLRRIHWATAAPIAAVFFRIFKCIFGTGFRTLFGDLELLSEPVFGHFFGQLKLPVSIFLAESWFMFSLIIDVDDTTFNVVASQRRTSLLIILCPDGWKDPIQVDDPIGRHPVWPDEKVVQISQKLNKNSHLSNFHLKTIFSKIDN